MIASHADGLTAEAREFQRTHERKQCWRCHGANASPVRDISRCYVCAGMGYVWHERQQAQA